MMKEFHSARRVRFRTLFSILDYFKAFQPSWSFPQPPSPSKYTDAFVDSASRYFITKVVCLSGKPLFPPLCPYRFLLTYILRR